VGPAERADRLGVVLVPETLLGALLGGAGPVDVDLEPSSAASDRIDTLLLLTSTNPPCTAMSSTLPSVEEDAGVVLRARRGTARGRPGTRSRRRRACA
jgi:hypothetical protein